MADNFDGLFDFSQPDKVIETTPEPTPEPVVTAAPKQGEPQDLNSIFDFSQPDKVVVPTSPDDVVPSEDLRRVALTGAKLEPERQEDLAKQLFREGKRRGVTEQKILKGKANPVTAGEFFSGKADPVDVIAQDGAPGIIGDIQRPIGAALVTAYKGLTDASTRPSKIIDEAQAIRSKPGEKSPSFERFIGSSANLLGSLVPGGQSPSEAWNESSIYEPEPMRDKLLRVYNTPIIDENGLVNFESLEYSNLDRWAQNELAAVWAKQVTGVNNVEIFRNILRSRGAVMKDDMVGAVAKRAITQPIDAASWNNLSRGYQKVVGTDRDVAALKGSENPKLMQDIGLRLALQGRVSNPFQTKNGKWVVDTPVGQLDVSDIKGKSEAEYYRGISDKFFDNVVQRLELQSYESGPQALDPTILFTAGSLGLVKGLVKGAAAVARASKAARILSPITKVAAPLERVMDVGSSVAHATLPMREGAGAVTAASHLLEQSGNAALKAVGVPGLASKIVDVAREESKRGHALRFLDKTLTQAAIFGTAAYTGAPRGMGGEMAAMSTLFSLGFTPLQLIDTARPTDALLQQRNKNYLKDVMNHDNYDELSNWSKKQSAQKMKELGTDYAGLREHYASGEQLTKLIQEKAEYVAKSGVKPEMAYEVLRSIADDPDFRKHWGMFSIVSGDYGVGIYGKKLEDAGAAVVSEHKAFLQRMNENKKLPTGTAASAPPASRNAKAIKQLERSLDTVPRKIMNSEAETVAWLERNSTSQHLPDDVILHPQDADAILAQYKAINDTDLFFKPALVALTLKVALPEYQGLAKTLSMAQLARTVDDIEAKVKDEFAGLPPEDYHQMLTDLSLVGDEGFSESFLKAALRRSNKPEFDDVSPVRAATILEENAIENLKKTPALYQVIKELSPQESEARAKGDIRLADLLKSQIDDAQKQIDAAKQNTFLWQMKKFAEERVKEAVTLRGKIREAEREALGGGTLSEQQGQQTRGLRGYAKERKILLEEAKTRSMMKKSEIEKYIKDVDTRLGMLENSLKDAESARDKAKVSKIKRDIKNLETYKRSAYRNLFTFDNRIKDLQEFSGKLAEEPLSPQHMPSVEEGWLDRFLVNTSQTSIKDTNFYKNLRRALGDAIEDSRNNLDTHMLLGNPIDAFRTSIPTELIAAVRLLKDPDWIAMIHGGEKYNIPRGHMPRIRREIDNLANHLSLISEKSRQSSQAVTVMEHAMAQPENSTFKQLLNNYLYLENNYWVDELLKDGKGGMTAFIENLVNNKKVGGAVSKEDFVKLQDLAKDSAVSRAYQTHIRQEAAAKGVEPETLAPWMVTYQKDVATIFDSLSSLDTDAVRKVLDEKTKEFVKEGLIHSEDDFDAKVAVGYFLKTAELGGVPKDRIVDLIWIAKGAHEHVKTIFPGIQKTEQLAVSVTRQTGMPVVQRFKDVVTSAFRAGLDRVKHGEALIRDLEALEHNGLKYTNEQRINSPVRDMIIKSLVAVKGHQTIPTAHVAFAKSGYFDGMTFDNLRRENVKSGLSPIESKDYSIAHVTSHLIINGEETAVGKAYREYLTQEKSARDFAHDIVMRSSAEGRLGEKADAQLINFLTNTFEFYGRMTPDEFDLAKIAIGTFQKHDAIGIEKVNAATREMNKVHGTSYPEIKYEPWRLDNEVNHADSDITLDPILLGSWRDSDKLMGNRYGTTPENQIVKSLGGKGIRAEAIIDSPEQLVLNRFTKLMHETYSRTPRSRLAGMARFLSDTGYAAQAEAVKNQILSPGAGLPREWWDHISFAMERRDVNPALSILGVVARQVGNSMSILGSVPNIYLQGLQQATLQASSNPTHRGALGSVETIFKSALETTKSLPSAFWKSIFYRVEQAHNLTRGADIKFDGRYASVMEEIYHEVSKRSSPYLELSLAKTRRGAMSRGMKQFMDMSGDSIGAQVANAVMSRFLPSNFSTKFLYFMKERSEVMGAGILLPQAGRIWQQGMEILQRDGREALSQHLQKFLTGPTATKSELFEMIAKAERGADGEIEGLRQFSKTFVFQNLGIWSELDIPQAVRYASRLAPGASMFYQASTMGMHRTAMALANTSTLTTREKAYAIGSVFALFAISAASGIASQETGLEIFSKVSPIGAISKAAASLASDGSIPNAAFNTLVKSLKDMPVAGGSIRIGAKQQMLLASLSSIQDYIKTELEMQNTSSRSPLDQYKNRNVALRRAIAAGMDMLGYSAVTRSMGLTSQEALQIIQEGLGVDMDDQRYEAMKAAYEATTKLDERREGFRSMGWDMEDAGAKGFTLDAFKLFSHYATQQQTLNAIDAFGVSSKDQEYLVKGMLGDDPFAEKYLREMEALVKRYEDTLKQRGQLETGTNESNQIPGQ